MASWTDIPGCHQLPSPTLERCVVDRIAFSTDPALRELGVTIAFTERTGGVSKYPFDSLNLATHVGDDLESVMQNRELLIAALGLDSGRIELLVPDQVHGSDIVIARRRSIPCTPPEADALITTDSDVGLLLCFADCVPVILVAPGPAICVVHAGWRGALASLPGKAARALAEQAKCATASINAYVGAHVGGCCYEVSPELHSRFQDAFGIIYGIETNRLNLRSAVTASLIDAGVSACKTAHLDVCTAENTDRFFSYRNAGGLTGRHGAFVCADSQRRFSSSH